MIIELLNYNLYICDNRKLVKMGKRNRKNNRKEDKSIDDSFVKKYCMVRMTQHYLIMNVPVRKKNFVSILEKDVL